MQDVIDTKLAQKSSVATPKPRLLIIELDHHAGVLTTLCPILAERFALVLWATDKIWDKAALPGQMFAATLIMPKKQTIESFWQQHRDTLLAVDLVYFNTLEKHFGFFAGIRFQCPTIMRIHNANASLFPAESIQWSINNLWKIPSYLFWRVLIQRGWQSKRQLYKKMTLLMLPSSGIASQVSVSAKEIGFDNIAEYAIPFSCLGDAQPPPPADTISFAVTGSVDAGRKDYDLLLQALQKLRQDHPEQKLSMVFLGSAKGKNAQKIIEKFLRLKDDHFNVEYFQDHVSSQCFAETMTKVHFLIAPLKSCTQYKIHREYYGKTKISGIENDALCHRKPVILPEDYSLPTDLKSIALAYRDADSLCEAVVQMIKNNHWQTLTQKFNNLLNYQREMMAESFFQFYQQLAAQKCESDHPENCDQGVF